VPKPRNPDVVENYLKMLDQQDLPK